LISLRLTTLNCPQYLHLFRACTAMGLAALPGFTGNDAANARMLVALDGTFVLAMITEGTETEARLDFLASQSCHAYQGYLFSRPLPLEGRRSPLRSLHA